MVSPRAFAVLLPLALAVPIACGGPARPAGSLHPEAAAWAASPVRWLLLPEEARELASLRQAAAAAAFRDRFWERRDPEPEAPGNPALDRFLERVAIADRLYGGAEVTGALTPRGRALVLLGPPSRLRVGAPAAPPAARRRPGRRQAAAPRLETWGWVASDLDLALRRVLPPPGHDGEWRLVFELDRGRERLVAGEALLAAAPRGWLREP